MRFLIDAQLPPALVQLLTDSENSAEHVMDVGLKDAEDDAVWSYAVKAGVTIITKDEDFAARILLQPDGPAIIWLRVGNCSNRALLGWFAPLIPDVLSRLQSGEKLIEIV